VTLKGEWKVGGINLGQVGQQWGLKRGTSKDSILGDVKKHFYDLMQDI
jgi:hypothetical protein